VTGAVVWITGLPGSGKSSLAEAAAEALGAKGVAVCILDSDRVREALSPTPAYSDEGRAHFYRTMAGLAALIASQGIVAIVAATAHRAIYRDRARTRSPRFIEAYVDTPVEECARRDPKGLYAQARAGEITGLPGIDAPYEPPARPHVVAHGGRDEEAARRLAEIVAEMVREAEVNRDTSR
jgi:adenylylsulfate kinase